MYPVQIKILEGQDASHCIQKWEEEDHYFKTIDESTAREVNKRARKYPYVLSSEGKATTITVNSDIPVDMLAFGQTEPIELVYLDGRSGAGLPHTRGKTGIALPVFLLWEPSEKTLKHELVHLAQKQRQDAWWDFYRSSWNFRPATGEEFMSIPERLRRRRRINPDTLQYPYTVWKDRYIALSLFMNELSPDLRFCKRGFWDLQRSQWTWEAPSGWEEMFGSGFNDEHPNEIAAHWIDGSAGNEKQRFFHLNSI